MLLDYTFMHPNPLYSGTQFDPYHGNGIATTWLVCWKPIDWLRLEMKYTFTYSFEALPETDQSNRSNKGKHDGTIQLWFVFKE